MLIRTWASIREHTAFYNGMLGVHHHHWILINLQVQEHLPHQWAPLQAHRADLTSGKTAICIFVAKFYGRCFIMVCLKSIENELPFIMVRNFAS